MSKTVVIIQARMSSTRLAGKILLPLGDKSVLWHVVSRVKACKEINEVIVATTNLSADDKTVEECKKIGVNFFRGSSDNVLERYYLAANQAKAGTIIRITSDCPFIDPNLLTNMLKEYWLHNKNGKELVYLSNTIRRCFPRGFDIEIFSYKALEKAFQNAKSAHEQEHVTPYIYNNPDRFIIKQYPTEENNSDLRVTLDTKEDWQVIKNIYENLIKTNTNFNYKDVVHYLRQHKDIAAINANVEQKK